MKAFLKHEYDDKVGCKAVRDRGRPQGNSLSLFVANAVGHALDVSLDQMSGNYLRYADDSVLVNYNYEDAIHGISAYRDFSMDTGVEVNPTKSTGVSIFSSRQEEMRTVDHVDFLGYRFSASATTISPEGISRIKKRCAQIIYKALLLYPKRYKTINCKRIDGKQLDWDLVSCIHRLRQYINRPFNNADLVQFLNGKQRIKTLSGCVSYYCLSDSIERYSQLDGWLVWALERALVERAKLVSKYCERSNQKALSRDEIISGSWFDRAKYGYEVSAPSFVLAFRASKKCWGQHGAMGVENQGVGSGD
jgi:RNA-directed DNA polymerase